MAEEKKSQESESGGSAVSDAKPKEKTKKKRRRKNLPLFHVVLLDDDDHSYEYVIEMMQTIFAYPPHQGFSLAKTVDADGRVIVKTTHKEEAELRRDQIHAYGTDHRIATCQGSMSALIEPAED